LPQNRASRNKTITLTEEEQSLYKSKLLTIANASQLSIETILNRTILGDMNQLIELMPAQSVDLLFLDPPYNLDRNFNGLNFKSMSLDRYEDWLDTWLSQTVRILKPTASIYICGDWRSSTAIHRVAQKYFYVQNRITWEREKGRGAKTNWKNNSEDIWFCTMSKDYTFNVDTVKLKKKVIAPYTNNDGTPKDWTETEAGRFRLTHPANLWTDITVPFWSMPENTDHPTQKPEKLMAKIILASTNPKDIVFDPFLGSGTTSVTAKKLGRQYIGIDINEEYCCLAEKRLALADNNKAIQGYSEGFFWERNVQTYKN